MSTEWYARTDKRRIQDTFGDIDTTPLTFAQWCKRHFKAIVTAAVAIAVLVAMFIVAFPVMFPKDTADYTVTLVTANGWSAAQKQVLTDRLEWLGEDRNGDGAVKVTVRELAVENALDGERNIPLEQLMTTLTHERYTLLAMEMPTYERYVKSYTADGTDLFEPLAAATVDNLWQSPATDLAPTLLWGVQAVEKPTDDTAAHKRLLETYVEKFDKVSVLF